MPREAQLTTQFQVSEFSQKQLKVLSWWLPNMPDAGNNGVIADGAIRSGKTMSMSLAFVTWAMSTFSGRNFAFCGKTIQRYIQYLRAGEDNDN